MNVWRWRILIAVTITMFSSLLVPLALAPAILAAPSSCSWQDKNTIVCDGAQKYILQSTGSFKLNSTNSIVGISAGNTKANHLETGVGSTNMSNITPIILANPANATKNPSANPTPIVLQCSWQDSATILCGTAKYTRQSATVFQLDASHQITAISADNKTAKLNNTSSGFSVLSAVALASPLNAAKAPTDAATTPPDTNPEVACAGSMSWIVCPVLKGALSSIDWVRDTVIVPFLKFAPLTTNNAAYPVWEAFRGIANVFLVLIFFITIFGTAIGFDNYTIKKILPRMIAAAVLIQFSWLIAGLIIDIGNILGLGIKTMLDDLIQKPDFALTSSGGTVASAAILLAGGAAISGLIGLELTTIIGAALALLLVFFVLVTRQVMILLLAALGPIAFLLWILPNTEKYFREWIQTLIKLSLMYPMIILLFEAGRLFAKVSEGIDMPGAETVKPLIALAGYAIPLFLIPATFTMAGRLMGVGSRALSKAHGAVGSRFGRGSDGDKKRAANRVINNARKLDDNKTGTFGRAVARKRSGFGGLVAAENIPGATKIPGVGKALERNALVRDQQMYGALAKQDQMESQVYGRQYKNKSNEEVADILHGEKSSLNQRSAALAQLMDVGASDLVTTGRSKLGQAAGVTDARGGRLAGVSDEKFDAFNAEWNKVMGAKYGDVKAKAPQALYGIEKGLGEMTAAQLSTSNGSTRKMLGVEIEAGNQPVKTRLLENLDIVGKSAVGRQNWDSRSGKTLYDAAQASGDPAFIKDVGLRLNDRGQLLEPPPAAASGGATAPAPVPAPAPAPAPGGGGAAPAPQPHPTPLSQPQQAQQVQTILEQHATQTSTPVGSVETQYTSDPTFKAQVDTAQAHNMSVNEVIRAQTPPKPTSSPLITPGETLSPGGIIIPGSIVRPGTRVSGPNPSLRLAPRDQTNEPGDDRSVS